MEQRVVLREVGVQVAEVCGTRDCGVHCDGLRVEGEQPPASRGGDRPNVHRADWHAGSSGNSLDEGRLDTPDVIIEAGGSGIERDDRSDLLRVGAAESRGAAAVEQRGTALIGHRVLRADFDGRGIGTVGVGGTEGAILRPGNVQGIPASDTYLAISWIIAASVGIVRASHAVRGSD